MRRSAASPSRAAIVEAGHHAARRRPASVDRVVPRCRATPLAAPVAAPESKDKGFYIGGRILSAQARTCDYCRDTFLYWWWWWVSQGKGGGKVTKR